MNIVVLDGYTLNNGDLSWNSIEVLGNLDVYDRTPPELVVERAIEAEILLTNKTPIPTEVLTKLPNLKYIGVLATGFNVVDIDAAAKRNIPVTNIPTYGTESVAQFVFSLLLELTSHVHLHSEAVRNGEWITNSDFCFTKAPLMELSGKTMGIIGFGRIGQRVAEIANVFGMRVLVSSRTKSNKGLEFVQWSPQSVLMQESDVISLHCPLTTETEGFLNNDRLSLMKRNALLINTSRGGLINEQDLADALNVGRIAGAGLDVLSTEPPNEDNPLLSAQNCLITPHIAWATKEARSRLMEIAAGNIQAFLKGDPVNVVNLLSK